MPRDLKMKHLVDQLFPNMLYRYNLCPGKPAPIKPFGVITNELIELVTRGLWMYVNLYYTSSEEYVYRNSRRILYSLEQFLTYVIFACYTVSSRTEDIYERFIAVNATAFGIVAKLYHLGHKDLLEFVPKIMTALFDAVLKDPFYKRGGWKRLDKYLLRQDYVQQYRDSDHVHKALEISEMMETALNFTKKMEALRKPLSYSWKDFTQNQIETHAPSISLCVETMALFQEDIRPSLQLTAGDSVPILREFEVSNSVGDARIIRHFTTSDLTIWNLSGKPSCKDGENKVHASTPEDDSASNPTSDPESATCEKMSANLSPEERCLLIEKKDVIEQTLEIALDNIKEKVEGMIAMLQFS